MQDLIEKFGQDIVSLYLTLPDSLTGFRQPKDTVHWNYLVETSTEFINYLESNPYKERLLPITLDHIRAFSKQAKHTWQNPNNYLNGATEIRDMQMARNLNWLIEYKYKGKKMIEEIHPPGHSGVESWLHNTGFGVAFFDLNQIREDPTRTNDMYYMKVTNYNQLKTKWHFIYDGIVFIDVIKPSISR